MRCTGKLNTFLLTGFLLCGTSLAKPKRADVLIVLDGFRHDYYRGAYDFDTPNLDALVSEGAFVPDVAPVFPSSRFPNIASLLTGRYSESHDVIDSAVYSKESREKVYANETRFWDKTRSLGTIWVSKNWDNYQRLTKFIPLPTLCRASTVRSKATHFTSWDSRRANS